MRKQAKKKSGKRSSSGVVIAILAAALVGGGLLYSWGQRAVALTRVPVDHVCMVNDKYFAEPQIPVPVGTKTYFGCCEMCKGRLSTDKGVRTATDPVSGHAVDKSEAVIGAMASGKVFYFESEETLARYQRTAAR